MFRKFMYMSVITAALIFTLTTGLKAQFAYGRFGLDCGSANNSGGALINFAFGVIGPYGIGGGLDIVASRSMGYEYNPEIETGDSRNLALFAISPEVRYVLMPSWPVNLSMSVIGGPGWIGSEGESEEDAADLNDAILFVKGRVALNLFPWDGFGFYIGYNYTKVFRSQNKTFTNKELSGSEISFGFMVSFGGAETEPVSE